MITTDQAAAIAHVERITIQKWIERGHLKAIKLGRDWLIDEKDLDALIAMPRKSGRKPKDETK